MLTSMRRLILGLTLVASAASAQEPNLFPGSRVRIIPLEKFEPRRAGKVVSVSSDSAVVKFEPVPEFELRSDVLEIAKARLEVRTSVRRRSRMGAVIGASTMAVAGFIVGSTAFGDFCEGSPHVPPRCHRDTSGAGPLFVAGAVTGAGIGAIVGHLMKSETWTAAGR